MHAMATQMVILRVVAYLMLASQFLGVTARSVETDAPVQAQSQDVSMATVDWAKGAASWQQATGASGNTSLWTKPNYCDSRVLHSSAPLTVLFGVSTFWEEIKHRRHSLALASSGATSSADDKPLEVHVLGAAYPFEGRSDWSLLASRRPADVKKVRIVLVLGTPWHQDNVPVMNAAKEFDEKRSFLMQFSTKVRAPETGKIKDGAIECKKSGSQGGNDESFRKADLCRDHGNGLEVVCLEKYYQDVSAELPKPDMVAMFSPGFPQIARRSWDQVLRGLLETEVPIMVGDLLYSSSVAKVFENGKSKTLATPGSQWYVKKSRSEDGMTLRAMRAYGARKLGAFRNPFPILITRGPDDVTAKNAVVQVFRGRRATAKPLTLPSAKAIEKRKVAVNALQLKEIDHEDQSNAEEIKSSMLIPTSKAYDKAMYQLYRKEIRGWVHHQIEHQKKDKPLSKEWLSMVEKLGLVGTTKRKKPWNVKEWMFVLQKLRVEQFF